MRGRARLLAARARRRRDPAAAACPDAGPGRGARPHAALRGQPRHRDAGVPRRRPARASTPRCARRSRRATSRARSSTATSASAWSSAGPAELRGRTVFCLYPHQTAYVVPAAAVTRGARRRARRRARCWPAPWRPRSTRCGTPRPLVGDRVAVVGAGMVGCCVARLLARHPRRARSTLVDVDPAPGRRRRGARGRLRPARRGRRRPRPGRARQRDVRRAAAVAGPARAGGHGHRPELVRRRRGPRSSLGGAFHSGRLAHPGQPGRHGRRRPGAAAAPPADRLALALELLRDPAFDALLTGAVRRSRSCPR